MGMGWKEGGRHRASERGTHRAAHDEEEVVVPHAANRERCVVGAERLPVLEQCLT